MYLLGMMGTSIPIPSLGDVHCTNNPLPLRISVDKKIFEAKDRYKLVEPLTKPADG